MREMEQKQGNKANEKWQLEKLAFFDENLDVSAMLSLLWHL